jgi:hypothetical protein
LNKQAKQKQTKKKTKQKHKEGQAFLFLTVAEITFRAALSENIILLEDLRIQISKNQK